MSQEKNKTTGYADGGECTGQAVVCRFIGVSRMHRKAIGKYSADIGLHHSQHRMLMHLANNEVIRSQKQLAEHFAVSPAAVATMLKKLEADGYIARAKSANGQDCRNNEIIITELGRRIATETEKYFRLVDSRAVKDFTDEEIEQFMRLLDKMQKNLADIGSPEDDDGRDIEEKQ
jgi:DNA-binding MarR family transcriptional regulator